MAGGAKNPAPFPENFNIARRLGDNHASLWGQQAYFAGDFLAVSFRDDEGSVCSFCWVG